MSGTSKIVYSEHNGYMCKYKITEKEIPSSKLVGTCDDKGRVIDINMLDGHDACTLISMQLLKIERISSEK